VLRNPEHRQTPSGSYGDRRNALSSYLSSSNLTKSPNPIELQYQQPSDPPYHDTHQYKGNSTMSTYNRITTRCLHTTRPARARIQDKQNHYDVLQVGRGSSKRDIKNRFYEVSLKYPLRLLNDPQLVYELWIDNHVLCPFR
jgi:hypothetical protein